MMKKKLYERLELWNIIEKVFDLNDENEGYWKEHSIRAKVNAEFRLGKEEKVNKIVENYFWYI
jgi:hypothetical protein